MVRVLFLINTLGGGGAERVLINLVNNMNQEKYDITILSLVDSGPYKQYLNDRIKYKYIFRKSFRGLNYIDRIPGIYHYTIHGNYDVIIAYLHGVWTRILAKAPRNQHTIAFLHANMKYSEFMKDLIHRNKIKSCFEKYDKIVAVSENVKQSFIETTGISTNVCVKYNTFNIPSILERSKEKNCWLLRNENQIALCSVGKLESVKGFDRMIRVMARLKEEGIFITWNVVGEGEDRHKLENMVNEYELNTQIKFLGFDLNPYKYIANSDLFVCSSYSEGFSSVVAESIIIGTPVLTTNCAGMEEMLGKNNEYGIIVDNDEDSLFQMLKTISLDKKILLTYKEKVKQRLPFFNINNTVGEVERMIDEVVK